MNGPTLPELTGVITRMALNYGRTFDDDDALMALVQDWAEQLDGFSLEDIELARRGLMADSHVRYFPTVADMRRRVQLAALDRRREEEAGLHCNRCSGTGWLDAGTDDRDYEYVRRCPDGCLPPLPGAVHQRRRQREGEPQLPLQPTYDFPAALETARRALTRPL